MIPVQDLVIPGYVGNFTYILVKLAQKDFRIKMFPNQIVFAKWLIHLQLGLAGFTNKQTVPKTILSVNAS